MLKEEFAYLWQHKFMILVLMAIALIPSIYAVTFLSSMWDPYGKTDQLPIAVVNQDKPTTMNGKQLSVGADLTKQLKDSDEFEFHFVSNQTANRGLASGKYYAVYKIPSDFSKNATTLLSDHPKPMKLDLEKSSGRSFIAGKMATTGATAVQTRLNGQIASTYAQTLVGAVAKLGGGVQQAAEGSGKIDGGAQKVNDGSVKLAKNLNTLADSSLKLQSGSKTLSTGVGEYVQAVVQAQSGSQQLAGGLKTVTAKLPRLGSGMSTLQKGSQSLATGLSQTQSGLNNLQGGADQLNQGVGALSTGSQNLATQSATFSKQLKAFAGQLENANGASGNSAGQINQLKTLIATTQTAIGNVSSSNTANVVSAAVQSKANELNLTSAQTAALQAAAGRSAQAAHASEMAQLTPLLTQLSGALNSLSAQTSGSSQASAAMGQLTAAADQLAAATQTLANSATQLQGGSQQVTNGVASASTATGKLTTGAGQLNSGLSSALPQIATLNTGINKLGRGANTLNNGLTTMADKGGTLQSGANALNNGVGQAVSGAQQLANGGQTLVDGTQTLAGGTQQLSNKLAASAAQLPKLSFNHQQSKNFASPVVVNQDEKDQVANNGTGMAPYMIGVSLYICALALNLMFDAYTPRKRPRTGIGWWASKATMMNGIAAIAATLVLVFLSWFNGFEMVNPLATWLLVVLGGMTLMAIVTWLNLLMGKVGTFLAMILLVLQLGGSAGTYPIQLSDHFFEMIHPYLPLSYVVDGLRSTVMIGNSPWDAFAVLAGIFIVMSLLQILHYVRLFLHVRRMGGDYAVAQADL